MSQPQPQFVDVSTYLVIEPTFDRDSHYWNDDKGRPHLSGAKITSATVNKPKRKVQAGGLITKVTLRVDANALLPLQPEAVIEINAGNTELIEIQADAPEPTEENE
jgi:hypothetical protein